MDDVHQYTSSTHKLELINACRLYLQVTFLSETKTSDIDTIIYGATIGFKQDLPAIKFKSNNQRKVNIETWQVWKSTLLTMYCNNGLSLKHDKKVRKWKPLNTISQQHSYYFSFSYNGIFHCEEDEKYT